MCVLFDDVDNNDDYDDDNDGDGGLCRSRDLQCLLEQLYNVNDCASINVSENEFD